MKQLTEKVSATSWSWGLSPSHHLLRLETWMLLQTAWLLGKWGCLLENIILGAEGICREECELLLSMQTPPTQPVVTQLCHCPSLGCPPAHLCTPGQELSPMQS